MSDEFGSISTASPPTDPSGLQPPDRHDGRPVPVPGEVALPSRSVVGATLALIGINILVYLANLLLNNLVTLYGALVPLLVVQYRQWWRLIVAGFLHADLMHIALNLYAFYGLGQLTERFFGTRRLVAIYSVSLLGAGVLVTLFSPLNTPTVGASGAIMGVLGALVVFFWTYHEHLTGGRNFLNRLIQIAVINIAVGLLPGISWWGHLGGFVFGALTGFVLIPRFTQRCVTGPLGELRCYMVAEGQGTSQRSTDTHQRRYLGLIIIAEAALLALAYGLRG